MPDATYMIKKTWHISTNISGHWFVDNWDTKK